MTFLPPVDISRQLASEIARRLLTAAVMIPLALAAAMAGGGAFVSLVGLAAVLVTFEWTRLTAPQARRHAALLPAAVVVLGLCAYAINGPDAAFSVLLVGAAVTALAARSLRLPALWSFAGLAYAAPAAIALVILRESASHGLAVIMWLFAVVWISDTAAFVFGRLIGGVRLAPRISPGKTWAGTVCAVAASALVGLAAALVLDDTSSWALAIASVGVGIAAILGDLAESWVKRRFGAKNTGDLIPGHGGMMDRVDSLVFAALAAAFVGSVRGGIDGAARGMLIW